MNKYLAYYLRLSQDDGNINDSNSIDNQRQLIKEYIYSCDEFVETQVLEFFDDGYSGTNFNRPGIQQLLEAVEKGEVGCIIVKDLSRFGRNYLEVSKYIEQIFPYIGVRFIAINDNYDSSRHKGTTAEIDMPIRNMINALYSMDISKKVKSAKRAKMKQGVYVSPFTIYGYVKDKVNKGKLLIDEPTAVIVKKIFELALDGITVSKIAEKLNTEHIPTPSAHKNSTGNKKHWNNVNDRDSVWTNTNIFNIIKDERYTGTFVGSMREIIKIGSNTSVTKPKEEWIHIPNNHPAIITREQFDKINRMIHKYPAKIKTPKNSHKPLYKKVWCGKCGHRLRYRSDVKCPYYSCEIANYTDKYGCMQGKIREKDINETVMATLLMQINLFIDNKTILRMSKNKIKKLPVSVDNSILHLDKEIITLQSNKRKLYEQYKNEEINQILYLHEREALEKELSNKISVREELVSQNQQCESILESAQMLYQKFHNYQSIAELTKEMADEFIETVNVYDTDRIEIRFKFKDEFERIFNYIQGVNIV